MGGLLLPLTPLTPPEPPFVIMWMVRVQWCDGEGLCTCTMVMMMRENRVGSMDGEGVIMRMGWCSGVYREGIAMDEEGANGI